MLAPVGPGALSLGRWLLALAWVASYRPALGHAACEGELYRLHRAETADSLQSLASSTYAIDGASPMRDSALPLSSSPTRSHSPLPGFVLTAAPGWRPRPSAPRSRTRDSRLPGALRPPRPPRSLSLIPTCRCRRPTACCTLLLSSRAHNKYLTLYLSSSDN